MKATPLARPAALPAPPASPAQAWVEAFAGAVAHDSPDAWHALTKQHGYPAALVMPLVCGTLIALAAQIKSQQRELTALRETVAGKELPLPDIGGHSVVRFAGEYCPGSSYKKNTVVCRKRILLLAKTDTVAPADGPPRWHDWTVLMVMAA